MAFEFSEDELNSHSSEQDEKKHTPEDPPIEALSESEEAEEEVTQKVGLKKPASVRNTTQITDRLKTTKEIKAKSVPIEINDGAREIAPASRKTLKSSLNQYYVGTAPTGNTSMHSWATQFNLSGSEEEETSVDEHEDSDNSSSPSSLKG